jgi:outer membrane protein assembly factor BamB
MEYVAGCSLRQLLETGPLPTERILAILDQIGQALDYAHRMGIVHRDVKPSNILVGADDQAMLIDFGLAEIGESTLLTTDGAVLGTPHYMAPEQAAGRGADARSDQYALAAVAYEMLAGAPPFDNRSATAVIHAHIYELPSPPTERRPHLPAAINSVLLRALAKQPHERYTSLAEFVAALRVALSPPLASTPTRPRRSLLLGAAGGLAIVVVLLLATLFPSGANGINALGLSPQTAARASLPMLQQSQPAPRTGVSLPQQVVWSYVPEPNLVGGPAPVALDDMLVVGTLDGQVLGLHAGSGELRWRAGGGALLFSAPSVGNGLVFAGSSDGFIQGLSLSSGKTTWQTKVVGVAQQAPTLDGDRLIVTTDKGYIYLLQAGSGQVIWDRPLAQSAQSPTVSDGRIFVSAGPTLFALDASDGAVDWSFQASGTITTRAVIAGDMVVVGTERGLLYALQIADGQSHLRFQARGPLCAAPAVGQNTIYIADQSGELTAIDLANASVLWRFAAGSAITTSPLMADGKLLFGAGNGMFYALDARGGEQLAHIQLDGSVVSPPALGAGLIFVRADKIYALGS